eukprot:scaffold375600_cov28-Prasinocladus_malaysianus.AAC.1
MLFSKPLTRAASSSIVAVPLSVRTHDTTYISLQCTTAYRAANAMVKLHYSEHWLRLGSRIVAGPLSCVVGRMTLNTDMVIVQCIRTRIVFGGRYNMIPTYPILFKAYTSSKNECKGFYIVVARKQRYWCVFRLNRIACSLKCLCKRKNATINATKPKDTKPDVCDATVGHTHRFTIQPARAIGIRIPCDKSTGDYNPSNWQFPAGKISRCYIISVANNYYLIGVSGAILVAFSIKHC